MVKANHAPSSWVEIRGKVLDAAGNGIADAMLEFAFNDACEGFQRAFTDASGVFQCHAPEGSWAHVTVFARGLLKHLFTRVYFDATQVPEMVPASRRATLVAQREGERYRWDVRLRGEDETVFFELV